MPPPITIIPLGTASAIPNSTRNHSSLAIIFPSSNTLLFDVGEGTQHQIQRFKSVKPGKISKIFITHLHGDHIFGLCPLLSSLCNGAGGTTEDEEDPRLINVGEGNRPEQADIQIYGPKGTREFVRSTLKLTYTHLGAWISISELLFPDEIATPCTPSSLCYEKEISGRDIRQDTDGFWRDICSTPEFTVSAGEIKHSVPCIGYVLTESPLPGKIPKEYPKLLAEHKEYFVNTHGIKNPMVLLSALQSLTNNSPESPPPHNFSPSVVCPLGIHLPNSIILPPPTPRPGRKIAVLGDTYDPSPLAPLALNSTCLIHESTNALLTPSLDPDSKTTDIYRSIKARTISRGHSTPEMAGRFAKAINLGGDAGPKEGVLVLNHFSSRYKDDEVDGEGGAAVKVMRAIRICAERAWASLAGDDGEGWGLEGMDDGAIEAAVSHSESPPDKRRGTVICARDGVKIEIRFHD